MASSSSMQMPSNPLITEDKKAKVRKATCTTRDGQCTHITMTRIYTDEFRCAICLEPGSMGWLYRCTQDRELLIEDDLEKDIMAPFDQLAALFPPSSSPKRRSAAARTSSSLAFLDEISPEDLKRYTPVQVSTILKQRTQLLDVARESESSTMMLATEGLHLNIQSENQLLPFPIFSTSPDILGSSPKKSWLPTQECQFKCCHRCRPSCRERSYLSLNAIADGELPATAITGFGFHYQKERPVARVEHVQNLGLRPNPILRKNISRRRPSRVSSLITPPPSRKDQVTVPSAITSSPFNDEPNADTTFGQVSNAYDSTAMTRSLNIESGPYSHGSGGSFGATVRKVFEDTMLMRRQEAEFKGINKFEIRKDAHQTAVRPPWTPPNSPKMQKENISMKGTASENKMPGSNGRSIQSPKTDHGLRSCFHLYELHEGGDVGLFFPSDDTIFSRTCATTLPADISDQQVINCLQLVRDDNGITRQALFGNDALNMDCGHAAEEEPVVEGASNINTSV